MQNFKIIGVLCVANAVLISVFIALSRGYGVISENVWYLLDALTIIVLLYVTSQTLKK